MWSTWESANPTMVLMSCLASRSLNQHVSLHRWNVRFGVGRNKLSLFCVFNTTLCDHITRTPPYHHSHSMLSWSRLYMSMFSTVRLYELNWRTFSACTTTMSAHHSVYYNHAYPSQCVLQPCLPITEWTTTMSAHHNVYYNHAYPSQCVLQPCLPITMCTTTMSAHHRVH